jgi:hypothetical protein
MMMMMTMIMEVSMVVNKMKDYLPNGYGQYDTAPFAAEMNR